LQKSPASGWAGSLSPRAVTAWHVPHGLHAAPYILSTRATKGSFEMKTTELTLPDLGLLVGTRGMLGAGLGLLLADRLTPEQRKGIGWTLAAIGIATTIPLAMIVFGGHRRSQAQ
jgi:hypothetical protein